MDEKKRNIGFQSYKTQMRRTRFTLDPIYGRLSLCASFSYFSMAVFDCSSLLLEQRQGHVWSHLLDKTHRRVADFVNKDPPSCLVSVRVEYDSQLRT